MTKSNLKALARTAAEITKSPEERLAALTAAFELFSKHGDKLEKAYGELKEQVQAKSAELHATTYYLNSILSHMAEGLLFIDLQGGVTTYNAAAEALFKIPARDVLFRSFWTHFKDEQFGFSMREALNCGKNLSPTYPSLMHPGEDPRELIVDTSYILQSQRTGTTIDAMQGIIVLIRDITDVRRWQTIAARNERLKGLGEMAAMAAHEIRNPLGGIKGFASLLQRDLQGQPALQKMAAHIVEGTDNLNRVVNAILDYARPVKPARKPTDLNELIKELKGLLLVDETLDPAIHIEIATPTKPLLASVDAQLLKSALLNLAKNSIQALPQGGFIRLSAKSKEGQAELQIADTGIGISEENQEKLFSPFFTTRTDGNGFGLAEVLKIVQAHGGTISVDSTEGQGTTFTLRIPLKEGSV